MPYEEPAGRPRRTVGPVAAPPAAHDLLLRRRLRKLPVEVDAELETRHGAVSLAEYSTSPQVLTLQTADGPRIVADPWYPSAA